MPAGREIRVDLVGGTALEAEVGPVDKPIIRAKMMHRFSRCLFVVALLWLTACPSVAQPADSTMTGHFAVYTGEGVQTSFEAIEDALGGVDVVLLGEEHNDPVAHFLQRRILERAFVRYGADSTYSRPIVLSMEQFTQDVQYILDEYLDDLIAAKSFEAESRPWKNYKTDYRPMVEFAKAHHLPVVAANAPRRYTNRVTRLGPEALSDLSDRARSYLAPLPYAMASEPYKQQWDQLIAESMEEMRAAMADTLDSASVMDDDSTTTDAHAVDSDEDESMDSADADSVVHHHESPPMHPSTAHMLEAQSLWDATMAYSIAENLLRRPGSLVIHTVGGFHVEYGTGIPEHLERYRPGTRRLIVSIRSAEDISAFDPEKMTGLGDFVILTDESIPRSFEDE